MEKEQTLSHDHDKIRNANKGPTINNKRTNLSMIKPIINNVSTWSQEKPRK